MNGHRVFPSSSHGPLFGTSALVRTWAFVLVLLGTCGMSGAAPAAQPDECKLCREDYQACAKAHSQGACKANYNICLKHCRRK
jgi:hypothetical protein